MAQVCIAGSWVASLKHQRIADQQAHAAGAGIPFTRDWLRSLRAFITTCNWWRKPGE